MAHMNVSWAVALLELLGVERVTIRAMSAESKDEAYFVTLLMMNHCGLIHLPHYLLEIGKDPKENY